MNWFWGMLLGLVPYSWSQMMPISLPLRYLGVQACIMAGSLQSLKLHRYPHTRKFESLGPGDLFVIFSSRTWDEGKYFHMVYLSIRAGSINLGLREALCKSLHLSNDKSLPVNRFCAVLMLFDFSFLNKSPVRSMIIDSISQNQFLPNSA